MLQTDGYELIPNVLDPTQIDHLLKTLTTTLTTNKAGTRNLLAIPEIQTLATTPPVKNLAQKHLSPQARCIRAILFDKSPEANWHLPFHQDRAIPVIGRIEDPAWKGWSIKEGVPHVLPPIEILENMLAIRLHLDDCGPDNAPLRIIPGTHKQSFIDSSEADTANEVTITCKAGDALLMSPLTLHASARAESPAHRRVIHLEYAAVTLPQGLDWYVPQSLI